MPNRTRQYHPNRKNVVQSITLDELLILSTTQSSRIANFLGPQLCYEFSWHQWHWLKHMLHSTKLPMRFHKLRIGGVRKLCSNAGTRITAKNAKDHLYELHKKQLRSALENLQVVRTAPHVPELCGIQSTLSRLQQANLLGQLREVFLLLCAHVILDEKTYSDIIQNDTSWDANYLLDAEIFVYYLLKADDMNAYIDGLTKRLKGPIPPSKFKTERSALRKMSLYNYADEVCRLYT